VLLESYSDPIIDPTDKGSLACTLKSSFKVYYPLVQVEINWQRGRFDFKVSDWRGTVGAAHRVEALGLDSGEVPGNSLGLLFGGVLLLLI
jgi:hypothetical protein